MTYPYITGELYTLALTFTAFRVKYLEMIKTLNTRTASSILARELHDFSEKKASVQKVMLAIGAREECINSIE